MNINELKTTLESILEQQAVVTHRHEMAVKEENFEAADILADTFNSLTDREDDINARIKEAGRPGIKDKNTAALVAANID